MTFLLDANVFLDFQNAGLLPELVAASQQVDMAVAEKVFDEVTLSKPGDSPNLVGKKGQAAAAFRSARLTKIEIVPGTSEAALMQTLLGPVNAIKDKDQGEAASIAVAASNDDLLFVTGDRTAVIWALNELYAKGERVMRVPIFVRMLLERGALDGDMVRRVAERASSHGAVPSGWASWLAGL